jgi:hypothetical protein
MPKGGSDQRSIMQYFRLPSRGCSDFIVETDGTIVIRGDSPLPTAPSSSEQSHVAAPVTASMLPGAPVVASLNGKRRTIWDDDAAVQPSPLPITRRRRINDFDDDEAPLQAADMQTRLPLADRAVPASTSNISIKMDEKQQYEDEAVESDCDFIDDEDPDESCSSAAEEVRSAVAAVRNRHSWQNAFDRPSCPLCADLKVVLSHLLGLD